jgi:Mn-containing catalase
VKPDDLLAVLREFHHEKLQLRQRHVAVARQVSHYAFNNTYQYVIAREDVHLAWLEAAIADLGGTPDTVAEPVLPAAGRHPAFLPLVEEDAREAAAFVSRWRARTAEVTHARHRSMMGVVLGETLEHKRFFDQMLAGREDLLGRRMAGAGTGNGVLPVRWLE